MSVTLEVVSDADTALPEVVFCLADGTALGEGALSEEERKLRGFSGKLGETLLCGEGRVLVHVGLGERPLDAEKLRRGGAAVARAASSLEAVSVVLAPVLVDGLGAAEAAQAIGEGAGLASYRFSEFKSEDESRVLSRLVLVGDPHEADPGAVRARATTAAVELCRDLVNTPAGDLSPRRFSEIATRVASESGLSIEVMDEDQIRAERLGGLLGVAAGSHEPARFVVLEYRPEADNTTTVALVGKGITFDSGGLSLKPPGSMITMKFDMSGAAAVLGAMSACRALEVAVRVVGLLPLTENMPGGGATRPGDVLHTRAGKTIEVLNTDAEGRLVLADALALAEERKPDVIVDLATLTGACVVALGREIAGLFTNDDRVALALRGAARRAGEALWPLPLPAGYRSHIDSEVADMKNTGANGQAGAIAGAQLLAQFVGETPWAHLDIAGPAWSEEDKGYRRKGGTGFGVRTILELLLHYEAFGPKDRTVAEGVAVLP